MSKSESTALALAENGGTSLAIAQADAETILAPIRENLGGDAITEGDLDRIKIPAGGITSWAVPSIDEDDGEEMIKNLEGVIVHTKIVRSYWDTSFDESGGGTPPNCFSRDGITGQGDPGGDCETCPMNQWPDDDEPGNKKPCKTQRLLFFLREDDILPSIVNLPPTSLKPFKKFLLRLTSKGRAYNSIVVKLSLEKDVNSEGIEFAKVLPTIVTKLEPEVHERVRQYGQTMASVFSKIGSEPDAE